jgi:hypothetical protein
MAAVQPEHWLRALITTTTTNNNNNNNKTNNNLRTRMCEWSKYHPRPLYPHIKINVAIE